MTRIVAGAMGGRRIEVPRSGTRPTSERVREALFARLDHYGVLDGARVLDLCAGSGALGLEAASRGAGDVTLVDSSRTATDTCRRNIRALGLNEVTAVTAKYTTGGAICKPTSRTTTPTMAEIQYMIHPKSVDRTGLLGASATGTL